MPPTTDPLPFWQDDLEAPQLKSYSFRFLILSFSIYRVFLTVAALVISFVIMYQIYPALAWGWAILIFASLGIGIYRRMRRKHSVKEISQIQQRAREQAGASVIGSALHVAGHPLLEREQPVVLTLVPEGLCIFPYENAKPLATISMQQLLAIHPVIYDDERVPHLDVLDSTAQALQLEFRYQDKNYTCLFRGMRKVRPIDWFHALQQKRSSS